MLDNKLIWFHILEGLTSIIIIGYINNN